MLACERKLQDFCLSHKNFVIPKIHSISHGFSPTKLKTSIVWVRKDLLKWVLFTCPWFNSFNYLRTCLFFVFGCLVFIGCFDYSKKKKIQKHWKFSKRQKYLILGLVLFFPGITWIIISLFWLRTYLILWRNTENMCCMTEFMSYFYFCMSMY